MSDYLLFQLYGPLSAWGDIAVGEYRPSFAHPSKSAIIGLLAAALGIRRDEEERHNALSASCSFAVRVDSMGVLMRDYHTIQVPPGKRGVTHYTRRSELAAEKLETILSSRDYRCDAVYTVAITVKDSSPYTTQQMADKLARPVFALYLGRKSCPLAMPLNPKVINAATLREALVSVPPSDELFKLIYKDVPTVFWEDDMGSGLELQHEIIRRDELRSRKRWQFSERHENRGTMPKGNKRMYFCMIRLRKGISPHDIIKLMELNGYNAHRLIWNLFADHSKRQRDFIYRHEPVNGQPTFYAVSKREPIDNDGIWDVMPKEYKPQLRTGQRLGFALRANPIRSRRDETGKQHRHDVVMEEKRKLKDGVKGFDLPAIVQEQGFQWLQERSTSHGFNISQGSVRVDGYQQHELFKRKGDPSITFSTVDFNGILSITEPSVFIEKCLFEGIGPAKGFGCGLMLVRRI